MGSRMQFSFVAATKQLTCSLDCPLGTDFRQHLTRVPYVRFLFLSLIFVPKVLVIPHMFQCATGGASGKESPASAGDRVQPLGQEDLLEEEMATHSSILAWRIKWTEEPGVL